MHLLTVSSVIGYLFFFFSSRRRHTRCSRDWSSDVCSSDLVATQTGLRLSEMTGLTRNDVTLSAGAHVRVIGKGRKERCVPFAKHTVAVLKAWLREPPRGDGQVLFPNARGTRLSPDGIHYLMVRHVKAAAKVCPSLKDKR